MKRSGPLNRYTPMPRSTKPMARSRINPISKAQRKRNYENAKWHNDYRRQFPECQCGECSLLGSDIHEVAGGSFRAACRATRAGVLHVARVCHNRIQGEPYARGLFRKLLSDPEGYDHAAIVNACGWAVTRVTIDDVLAEGERMGKKLKTLDEAQQDYNDLCRKCELLRRRLADLETKRQRAANEFSAAGVREQKIAAARRLVPDEQ